MNDPEDRVPPPPRQTMCCGADPADKTIKHGWRCLFRPWDARPRFALDADVTVYWPDVRPCWEPSQTSTPVDDVTADRRVDPSAPQGTPDLAASAPDRAADVAGTTDGGGRG